jgi:DnaJ-class molecular chaperone
MFTTPGASERPVTQDDAERASGRLGVHLTGLIEYDVREAFRAAIRAVHPDAGGNAAAAPERLKELRAARDMLLRWLEQAPKATCKECGGSGYVMGSLAVKPCSRCG